MGTQARSDRGLRLRGRVWICPSGLHQMERDHLGSRQAYLPGFANTTKERDIEFIFDLVYIIGYIVAACVVVVMLAEF